MSKAKGSDVVSTLIGLALVVGIGGGLFFAFGGFGGDTLGRISMSSEPHSVTIDVDEAGTLQIWADLEITHRGLSPSIAAVDLPHVMDYAVDVTAPDGTSQSLRCNPFDAYVMRHSDQTNSIGKDAGRWYDGRIEGCAFPVSPGAYNVTARTVEVTVDPRVSLQKNDAVLRLN